MVRIAAFYKKVSQDKKYKLESKRPKDEGFTLVALVVTIVVLLILAGITIVMLFGENGVINKADNAAEETKRIQEEEKEGIEDLTGSMLEKIGKKGITADSLANIEDKSSIYGKTVSGYNCINSDAVANWKIFYVGNEFSTDNKNRIYLIADDYIPRDKIPRSTVTGETGHELNPGNSSYPKAAYFTNILNDYTEGSASITDTRLKKLNNDYFNTKNYSSTENNMKAVAYMMDISAWSVYKDSNKAEYAIGGPTVEMTLKSYSQKHNIDFRARAKDANGYEISKDGGVNWANNYGSMLEPSDALYVLPSTHGASSIWLSSPSANNSTYMMIVGYSGYAGGQDYTNKAYGFRPLVCLNPNVQLEQLPDGNYKLK